MDSLTSSSGPRMYPDLKIQNNANPNKLYAIPLLGFFIKCFMLIPAGILLFFIAFGVFFTTMLINPFVVLFTGKYWQPAYELTTGLLCYNAKIWFFMAGVTDKYPGFDLQTNTFTLTIPMPNTPNKLYAIPLLGIFIRMLLMIPYFLWVEILVYASFTAIFFSFIPVLFMGKYPQVTYELTRDTYRNNLASSMYLFGLSDTYPSFWIDLKNSKALKIVLLILGALIFIWAQINSHSNQTDNQYQFNNYGNYQNNSGNYNLPTSAPGQ